MENILSNRILELSAAIYPRAKGIREHLHAHPELSWNESNTAKYIQSILDEHHISYTANIATHGIVASISGINPKEKCQCKDLEVNSQ